MSDAEQCRRCGHRNIVWCTPSPLWNAVIRGGCINGEPEFEDMVCPNCFMELAEAKGIATKFRVSAETINMPLQTVTPSGRIWDEEDWIWRPSPTGRGNGLKTRNSLGSSPRVATTNPGTPLVSWFYAIYLFCTTRHGVSGKELQRQLGVTYKTAWRMGQQIRQLTEKGDFNALLSGHVELDEAYVGGKVSGGKRGRGAPGKTIVMGLAERGGKMKAAVIPNVKKDTLRGVVLDSVVPGSTVSTDELYSYNLLTGDGYQHGVVKHGRKEYAYFDYRTGANHHVNTVEGFWRLFKASIRSTHVHISPKYMQRYLAEFTFRANHRDRVNGMFDLLVGAL